MNFERELAYLDLFFSKLHEHAEQTGANGTQLKNFVNEERRRWLEARAWLAGPSNGLRESEPAAVPQNRQDLSVGSLRGP
jgi:hypothetical protein